MEVVSGNQNSATDVQLSQAVSRTPDSIMERYRKNPHWKLYEKEWIYKNFDPGGKSWMDLGCGTGEITSQLALLGATRVVAIDVTPGLVEMTQRRAELDGVASRVNTMCGDLTELKPEPVDVVLAYAVLHHVPDRLEPMVGAIRNWLKPGGVFIFCEPVCYLPAIEWMRNHSGVHADPLDPGERKLTSSDLKLIQGMFNNLERVHFRTVNRLTRVLPSADRQFRRVDAMLRHIPAAWRLSGTVIGMCRK